MNSIFDNIAEIYRGKIQPGTAEEVNALEGVHFILKNFFQIECIEQAYELSVKTWNNGNKAVAQSYLSVEEACKVVKENVKEELPKPEKQPKRFTVHASADPSKNVYISCSIDFRTFL